MNKKAKIALGIGIPVLVLGIGGIILYANRDKLTRKKSKTGRVPSESEFARLVQTAHDSGAGTFRGMSTKQLDDIYKRVKENLNSLDMKNLTALHTQPETNWTDIDKAEYKRIINKLKSKNLTA